MVRFLGVVVLLAFGACSLMLLATSDDMFSFMRETDETKLLRRTDRPILIKFSVLDGDGGFAFTTLKIATAAAVALQYRGASIVFPKQLKYDEYFSQVDENSTIQTGADPGKNDLKKKAYRPPEFYFNIRNAIRDMNRRGLRVVHNDDADALLCSGSSWHQVEGTEDKSAEHWKQVFDRAVSNAHQLSRPSTCAVGIDFGDLPFPVFGGLIVNSVNMLRDARRTLMTSLLNNLATPVQNALTKMKRRDRNFVYVYARGLATNWMLACHNLVLGGGEKLPRNVWKDKNKEATSIIRGFRSNVKDPNVVSAANTMLLVPTSVSGQQASKTSSDRCGGVGLGDAKRYVVKPLLSNHRSHLAIIGGPSAHSDDLKDNFESAWTPGMTSRLLDYAGASFSSGQLALLDLAACAESSVAVGNIFSSNTFWCLLVRRSMGKTMKFYNQNMDKSVMRSCESRDCPCRPAEELYTYACAHDSMQNAVTFMEQLYVKGACFNRILRQPGTDDITLYKNEKCT